ncbi:MAG: hypothetical protein LAO55_09170 [Acidobacteriia bacterium]|nr:hypothetical protein [Terriglobia bacterium]
MRSSLALPSSLFRNQIPGLSDFGHILVSLRLPTIDALWYASCGAGTGPLEDAYDVFASVISRERTLDETLIGTTIPSLVAEAAEEYGWFRSSTPVGQPLKPQLLEQIRELVRIPIARWTAAMPRVARSDHPLRSTPSSAELKLSDLPLDDNGEPQDIIACRSFRQKAIVVYKQTWRTTKHKVTDVDIAKEAGGWEDRTYVGKFKRCDPKNTLAVDRKIWRVLRSTSTPSFIKAGTPPK